MSTRGILGQTGKTVLSVALIHRKRSKRKTIRFQFMRIGDGWIAWVCGPFRHRLYGQAATGYARHASTAKARAKSRAKLLLADRLAREFGYFGNLMYSDLDESDIVGLVQGRD